MIARALAALALLAATALPHAAPAQVVTTGDGPKVSFAMNLDEVEISSGFRGSELMLFGTPTGGVPGDYDVVITVTGPPGSATLRRKDRVAGIWMFTEEAEFPWLPGFYTVATSGPFDDIVSAAEDQLHGISPDTYIPPPQGLDDLDTAALFVGAMHRLTERSNRVTVQEGIVHWSEDVLFQARIQLPVSLVPGTYHVRVFLLQDGRVLSRSEIPLPVRKSSLQRTIYRAAQDHGTLYGIAAALISIFAGWLASVIFRRR